MPNSMDLLKISTSFLSAESRPKKKNSHKNVRNWNCCKIKSRNKYLPPPGLQVRGELRPQEDGGRIRRCTALPGQQCVCFHNYCGAEGFLWPSLRPIPFWGRLLCSPWHLRSEEHTSELQSLTNLV